MKKKIIIIAIILAALLVSSYYLFFNGDKKADQYTFTQISRGSVSQTITATGTLQAVTTVDIGTQVSGKITKLYVDFNDHVRKGQLLAVIDTTNLITQVHDGRSNLEKAKANYHQAQVTDEKNKVLYQKNYISELDYLTSQTNVEGALADMKAAQSALDRAITNLGYAYIYAPISGIIQNRAVEAGQTVAASLSAPTLFTIAEDLDKMEILANIDESDIGQIALGQKVDFSVQAYPDKKFWGTVVQKRINSAVVSNVVNYTVVVNADNKDHLLLPGMTATMDFYIQERDSVLIAPNVALRFTPTDDQLAEYTKEAAKQNGDKADTLKKGMGNRSGGKSVKSQFGRLWYLDQNGKLQMSPIVLGITDGKNTEIVRGRNIKEGMKVISGIVDNSAPSTTPQGNSLIPQNPMQQRGQRRGCKIIMSKVIIETRELVKTYQVGDMEVNALKGINLKIFEGEFVAIMGASGSGKSTFMNVIGCLDQPTSGDYFLDDVLTSKLDKNQYAEIRNQKIGFVFQGFNLLSRTTALENVELPLMYDRQHRIKDPKKKAIEVLERVGLGDRMDHVPNQLSGGQQQRVAIARALVNEPSLILADEPTGNLDSRTSVDVFGLFQQLNSEGITIVLVTHERDYANFSKRIVELRDGKVIRDKEIEKPLTAKEELEKLKSEEVNQETS